MDLGQHYIDIVPLPRYHYHSKNLQSESIGKANSFQANIVYIQRFLQSRYYYNLLDREPNNLLVGMFHNN
ncbi:hypothetical protein SAMN04487895_10463 [Paenibacillus sophorae]|uniref:Uncharacterized protein n=1 Tax=Paenibacillus sophorae TaxID=1333845 RepID=A0A1H8KYD8_9BACL|nr:hypothetical protein SAMN04487895_10463 [Paenibacillus sophorae]